MSSFTNALVLQDTGDGKTWRVHEKFVYYVEAVGSGLCVPVNAGFETDLTSVPGLIRSFIHQLSKANAAAVVHDRLYAYPWLFDSEGQRHAVSKFHADRIFLEAMEVSGVSTLHRYLLYVAVRYGGGIAWTNHRKRDMEQLMEQSSDIT